MRPFVLDEPVNGTFWPELENNSRQIGDYGTGYYNVLTVTTDLSMIGYRFDYLQFDRDGTKHTYSSISLPRLRSKVLNAGHKWEVLDVDAAMTTLTLNLLDMHFRNVERASRLLDNFSGVGYVRRVTNVYGDKMWVYRKYDRDDPSRYHFAAKTLKRLEKKAKERDVPWNVFDEELYYQEVWREGLSL